MSEKEGFNALCKNFWMSISAHNWVYIPMAKAVLKEMKKDLHAYYKKTKETNSIWFLKEYRHKIFETIKKLFKKFPTEDPFEWNTFEDFEQFYNMVRGRFCMQNEYPIELFNFCVNKWEKDLYKYYTTTDKPTYSGVMGMKIRGKTFKQLIEKACKDAFTSKKYVWPFR